MKIVSLLPSATEIVYYLGLGDELAGVTYECDHPPAARHLPVVLTTSLEVGDGMGAGDIDRLVSNKMRRGEPLYRLDEEAIRSIQPDLILAQDLCHVCAVPSGQVNDALRQLGCRAEVISLDPTSLDDILSGMEAVAAAAGGPSGSVARLRDRIERVRSAAASLDPMPTLALEWADPPFIAGHWVPEIVAIAGGTDVMGRPGERSRRVGWDDIAAARPELVVFMPCGYDLDGAVEGGAELWHVADFAGTPAAQLERVFAVDASSFFSRPGPRIVDGLELLAWILHPEHFDPPPDGRVARLSP